MSDDALRGHIERLEWRVARIDAAAVTLREIASRLGDGGSPQAVVDALETLDRDLLLAAHDLDEAQRAAMRELASLSGASERADGETA